MVILFGFNAEEFTVDQTISDVIRPSSDHLDDSTGPHELQFWVTEIQKNISSGINEDRSQAYQLYKHIADNTDGNLELFSDMYDSEIDWPGNHPSYIRSQHERGTSHPFMREGNS